jgi:DNA-binding PadR family transcriptional regulator
MHPYEMRTTIQHREHDHLVRIKGASLYDTVDRLAREGLIEATETSREGKRPERTVYRITESGSGELDQWLREALGRPVNEFPQFATALAFMYGLEKSEVVELLRRRMLELEAAVAATDVKLKVTVDELKLPRIFVIEEEYLREMQRAEAEWIRTLIGDLLEGALWPSLDEFKVQIAEFQRRSGGSY